MRAPLGGTWSPPASPNLRSQFSCCCSGAWDKDEAEPFNFIGLGHGADADRSVGGKARRSSLASHWCLIVVTIVVVWVVLVGMFYVSNIKPPATTTPATVGAVAMCVLWGAGHIDMFDRQVGDFHGEGERWLVKTPWGSLQARYLALPGAEASGLSTMRAVAVGGWFMRGHTLAVRAFEEGDITWDGIPILGAPPSQFDAGGLVNVSYSQETKGQSTRLIVRMLLPFGLEVEATRWNEHIDVSIRMAPRAGGQDGFCGNANGLVEDDAFEQIQGRLVGNVLKEDLLFGRHEATFWSDEDRPQPKRIADCSSTKRQWAEAECKKKSGVSQPLGADLLEKCARDVCFGGVRFAGSVVTTPPATM
mmetsp:Transcript_42700/g.123425  ORF Transcript_42700/g.123425 Transcript_42700/m.123425 type:complete len:362 (+) Transcript_42700:104-1189(+)